MRPGAYHFCVHYFRRYNGAVISRKKSFYRYSKIKIAIIQSKQVKYLAEKNAIISKDETKIF